MTLRNFPVSWHGELTNTYLLLNCIIFWMRCMGFTHVVVFNSNTLSIFINNYQLPIWCCLQLFDYFFFCINVAPGGTKVTPMWTVAEIRTRLLTGHKAPLIRNVLRARRNLMMSASNTFLSLYILSRRSHNSEIWSGAEQISKHQIEPYAVWPGLNSMHWPWETSWTK